MEELYKRTENPIRTRALTVTGTEGYMDSIKASKTEALKSPRQATQQDNIAVEEPSRQSRDSNAGLNRDSVTNVAQEVLLRFLASQVTGYNHGFSNVPAQAMYKIQETYEGSLSRASGTPPPQGAARQQEQEQEQEQEHALEQEHEEAQEQEQARQAMLAGHHLRPLRFLCSSRWQEEGSS